MIEPAAPTYTPLMDAWVCSNCGAVVGDRVIHGSWHEEHARAHLLVDTVLGRTA